MFPNPMLVTALSVPVNHKQRVSDVISKFYPPVSLPVSTESMTKKSNSPLHRLTHRSIRCCKYVPTSQKAR
jgi:hypothetical protein